MTSLAGKRVTLSIKGDEVTLVEVPAEEPAPAAAAASTTSELPKAKADKTAAAPKVG